MWKTRSRKIILVERICPHVVYLFSVADSDFMGALSTIFDSLANHCLRHPTSGGWPTQVPLAHESNRHQDQPIPGPGLVPSRSPGTEAAVCLAHVVLPAIVARISFFFRPCEAPSWARVLTGKSGKRLRRFAKGKKISMRSFPNESEGSITHHGHTAYPRRRCIRCARRAACRLYSAGLARPATTRPC